MSGLWPVTPPVKAVDPKLEALLEASKRVLAPPLIQRSVDVYLDSVDVSNVGLDSIHNRMEIVLRCTVPRDAYQDAQKVLMGGQMNRMLTLTANEAPQPFHGPASEVTPRIENPLASSW